MKQKYEKLAYCGLFCGGCRNYKENLNCMGCRLEENLVDDCPTRACAAAKNLVHCGECDEFPCAGLQAFYDDGVRHHGVALENIRRIKDVGPDKWLAEQEEEHTCDCGARRLWFAEKCTHKPDSV
jgi:hypothetical protein